MHIIYLVTPFEGDWDGMLDGYATDAEGIKRLIQDYLSWCETLTVKVDLEKMAAGAVDEYGCNFNFRIRELKGITCQT